MVSNTYYKMHDSLRKTKPYYLQKKTPHGKWGGLPIDVGADTSPPRSPETQAIAFMIFAALLEPERVRFFFLVPCSQRL